MPLRGHLFCSVRVLVLVATLILLGAGGVPAAQVASPGYAVGILPFQDTSGSDYGGQLKDALAVRLRTALLRDTHLRARVLAPPEDQSDPTSVDASTVAQWGRNAQVDLVLVGSLQTADVQEQTSTINGPSFGGVSVSAERKSQDATVEVQLDVVDANRGTHITTLKATGKDHEGRISPDVDTDYGSMDMGGADFEQTALGKATQRAMASLVKDLEHTAQGFTPGAPPATPAAAPAAPETETPAQPTPAPAAPPAAAPANPAGPAAGGCRAYFRVILSAVMVPLKEYTVKVNGEDHSSEVQNGILAMDNPPAGLSFEVSISNPPQGVKLQPAYAARVECHCDQSPKELVLEIGWKGDGKFNWWY